MNASGHRRKLLLLIGALGGALLIALWPFVSGIMGSAVFFVIFRPMFRRLSPPLPKRLAASVVVLLAVLLVVIPGLTIAGLVVNGTQELAGRLADRPIFGRLADIMIGPIALGPYLLRAGERLIDWLGSSAFDLFGRAARVMINIVIAMFGLFYLLLRSSEVWREMASYLPFSQEATNRIGRRFRDITLSTLIGTGVIAVVQGTLVGIAFAFVGVASPIFWGIVTAMLSTIPFVGSGFVWGPAVVALLALDRYGAAIGVGIWGAVVVASADNFIRPFVYAKWANVHPMVTLLGVVAGIRFFGILGVLLGPMALSYFLEFARIYRDDYESRELAHEVPEP